MLRHATLMIQFLRRSLLSFVRVDWSVGWRRVVKFKHSRLIWQRGATLIHRLIRPKRSLICRRGAKIIAVIVSGSGTALFQILAR